MKPEGRIVIETDKKPAYGGYMKELFGDLAVHHVYDASVADNKNKLFSVNNMIACMRANISMLRRKSWHICKENKMLNARLNIYKFFSNYFLQKSYTVREGGKKYKMRMTPAMHLGIVDRPVGIEYLYNWI